MLTEKEVLLSLLKSTKTGPVSTQLIVKISRMPKQVAYEALAKFSQLSLFKEYDDIVEASPSQRVEMSVHALHLGVDFQRVCSLLSWAEFEGFAAQALDANGYRAIRNFHFKNGSKKWEIDILGLRKPHILCIDCKHWRHGWRNAASLKAVEAQVERTAALAKTLLHYTGKIGLEGWTSATFVPVVLSLLPRPEKFVHGVPVVPILQLQDFINTVPAELHSLPHIVKKCNLESSKLTDFAKSNS